MGQHLMIWDVQFTVAMQIMQLSIYGSDGQTAGFDDFDIKHLSFKFCSECNNIHSLLNRKGGMWGGSKNIIICFR